jgi:catecholate siderophore receptor
MTFPNDKSRALPLLPLGALAAGFGLAGLAAAQAPAAAPQPAAAASASAAAAADDKTTGTVMPTVKAKASAVRQGKESVQAVTTSIGKGTQELRDIPQSVTVVTERLIDDRNLDTLKEALHNTAGISFQAAEGGEEDIRLRGFSLAATGDIFVDGVREPAFFERDTFNYDRLEVLRGSASMLFGRGSTGGAVNQVNKQPLLYGRNEVDLTLGNGKYARATADLNLRTGENAALRVNVMKTDADNWGNFIDKEGVAATYALGIGTRDEFSLGVYYLDNHNGVNYGMPWLPPSAPYHLTNNPTGTPDRVLIDADPKNYYGAGSDYSDGSAKYATLSHIHRFGQGSELKTVLRKAKYDRDLRASAIRFCLRPSLTSPTNSECSTEATTLQNIGPNTILTRGNNVKIQQLDTLNFQSDYSGRFQLGGMKHSVQAGVDYAHEEFANFAASALPSAKPKTTLGSPNDGGGINEAARLVTMNRTFDAKALGAYAQDLIQIAPQWKVLAGLRWDRFEGDYNTPQIGATAPTHRARSDSLWSKRVGVLFQPTAFQSYHLSYGTSFNTSGDTYQYDLLGSNTPPEGSKNFEIGGKLDLADGNLSVRFALFHSVKTNERNRDTVTVLENPTSYVLSGQRHASGIELDIAGRITPAWEVFASYAFIPEAEIDKGAFNIVNGRYESLQGEQVGARPGGTPKHSGTIWTTYKLGAFRLGGGINARSADAPPLIDTFKAPAYVTGDLMAEYALNEDLTFKLNVTNVTNKLYADMLYRGHYIPGKPRTIQLTTSYRF